MKKVLCLFLSACFALMAWSQELTVNGVVVDVYDKEPLPGVSVMIKDQFATAVMTDIDGKFTIKAPKGAELVFSFIDYNPSTVKVTSDAPLTVDMTRKSLMLEEVVAIGYGVQKKSDITGAISSISSDDIERTPVSNPIQALQGRASGVQVMQNTGAPGAASTIKIRGTGTVNDSDPLYVVDGFIVDNIDHINPNDIASMEVLKDAASSSIYGARSANGVLLITTKSGEKNKLRVVFDTYVGFSNPWKKIDVMGVEDFALMRDYVEGHTNYSYLGQIYHTRDKQGNDVFDDGKYHRLDSIRNTSPSSWWDAVTRTGIKQSYNLNISGGGEKTQYMVSGSYYNEKGIVRTSDYERFTMRMNLNNHLTSWMTLRTNMLYTHDDKSRVPEGQNSVLKRSLHQSPLVSTYNVYGYWQENHPLAILDRYHNDDKNDRLDLNLSLDINLGKYFKYQFKFSNYTNFYNRYLFAEVAKLEENFVLPDDLTSVTRYSTRNNKLEMNNIVTFDWSKNKHSVSAVVGQTLEKYNLENVRAVKQGTPGNSENLRYLDAAYFGDWAEGGLREWNALGFLGRVNYSFDNRYLLQANFRADASSKFSKKDRWGYFPSASVGWRFSSEEFMRSLTALSFGKLRVGWGLLGNNRIDEYARYTIINNEFNYSYGLGNHTTQSGATATSLGNDHLKWEKTTSYNIGLDLGFFNNMLTATFEYYDKKTSDMLLRVPVSIAAGLNNAPMVNAGDVSNRGFEATINYNQRLRDFSWSVGFNLSYNKNKVTSLGLGDEPIYGGYLEEPSIQNYVTRTEVGMPIGYFYGYVTDGIFQTPEEVAHSAQNDGITQPGDFRFKDLNNDGKIDANDRTYLGSPHPDFVFGVPITVQYKNFSLSMFFQGQWGNKIFNVMEYYLNSAHGTGNVYADLRQNHWSGSYVADRQFWPANPNGTVPDLDTADRPFNYRASDFYVKNGSYVRLKDVRFTYTLPSKLAQKLYMQDALVYVSAYNLLTFTKYNGLDPEVGRNDGTESSNLYLGVDHGNYPQSRQFMVGLKLTF